MRIRSLPIVFVCLVLALLSCCVWWYSQCCARARVRWLTEELVKSGQALIEAEQHGTFLEALLNVRNSRQDDTEARLLLEESTERLNALLTADGAETTGLPELWNQLRTLREEMANGRNVTRNRELAARASVAFSQQALAKMEALKKQQEQCQKTATVRSCVCIVGILLALVGILFAGLYGLALPMRKLLGRFMEKPVCFPDVRDLEQALLKDDSEARQSADAKDQFFASMSHEIRTPLNGIVGFLGSLAETDLDPQQQQYLNLIRASSRSLLHIIDEILDFSKLNAGKLALDPVAFDFQAFLGDRVAIAEQLLRSKRNVRLVTELPEEAPLIIRQDPMRLRQILDNLLSNAVKFTERGEISLQVGMSEAGDGILLFHVAVRDTGTGIAQQEQQKLFQPYAQAEAGTARKYGGTGLGLAISAALVRLLGGNLQLQSRPGEGSVFQFDFSAPRAKQEERVHISENFQVSLPRAELKKKFALLVDDTPTNLFLLETICQGCGLPYQTAHNGLEALHLCQQEHFDLIFMDIQMPVMDGYAAMREIRSLPDSGTPHIIALTASAYQEDVEHALASGADSFLPKPFEREQLLLCIAEALGIQPQRQLRAPEPTGESPQEAIVRQMHDFMREQYGISLGEIKMVLAQTAGDWRPVLDNLVVFARKGQMPEVRAILHKLKGQLSSIGLMELSGLAASTMEGMEQGQDPNPGIQRLISELGPIFLALEKEVSLPQ